MKNEYEINKGTLAVISMEDGKTKILEDSQDYIIPCSSYDILDHSCKYFGSSYEGRRAGAKAIIGANYKLPIVIQDNLNIVFFPTMSPTDKRCIYRVVENQIYRSTRLVHLLNERRSDVNKVM